MYMLSNVSVSCTETIFKKFKMALTDDILKSLKMVSVQETETLDKM